MQCDTTSPFRIKSKVCPRRPSHVVCSAYCRFHDTSAPSSSPATHDRLQFRHLPACWVIPQQHQRPPAVFIRNYITCTVSLARPSLHAHYTAQSSGGRLRSYPPRRSAYRRAIGKPLAVRFEHLQNAIDALRHNEKFETVGIEIALSHTSNENTTLARRRSRILGRREPNGRSSSGARPQIGRTLRAGHRLHQRNSAPSDALGLRSNQRRLTPPSFSPFCSTIHLLGRFTSTSQRLKSLGQFTKHGRCDFILYFW